MRRSFSLKKNRFDCSWCGPCKALEPRLENVVAKRNGKISLAKVDIDSLGEVAAKYEVSNFCKYKKNLQLVV